MKQRVLTGILAVIFFIPIVFYGGWPFQILVYLLATIAITELMKMRKISIFSVPAMITYVLLWILLSDEALLSFFAASSFSKVDIVTMIVLLLLAYTVLVKNAFTFDEVGFLLLSSLYIGMGFFYLMETRVEGLHFLFYALFVIWATDTGAYFIGRAFGRRKLWPEISPKKTIEGSIGGIASACIVAIIFQLLYPVSDSMSVVIGVTILASIVGQIGDLVESAFKRTYHVKDSGNILPGHGGILDRFDSLIFVLPLLHFIQFI
ncbi:phosphatidate cytidylyltransferase [Salirhabdus salicampi]|uniref:phosphatidate cytidylyltransferase n=1 Tax=Salirhabdus salicampi TaxID=476102 RepID=UPI0020C35159|nr:phosphatidate cytidylyltransferase [Salirhabdus salicampi]MCP8616491.1 phosphatidate cytidylyltransferase [Salirhabdus salicampi]